MDFVPRYEFHKCVQRYQGTTRSKRFLPEPVSHDGVCQLTYRESLRDTQARLRAAGTKFCITWASAAGSLAIPWPMPIRLAIGASTRVLLRG